MTIYEWTLDPETELKPHRRTNCFCASGWRCQIWHITLWMVSGWEHCVPLTLDSQSHLYLLTTLTQWVEALQRSEQSQVYMAVEFQAGVSVNSIRRNGVKTKRDSVPKMIQTWTKSLFFDPRHKCFVWAVLTAQASLTRLHIEARSHPGKIKIMRTSVVI